MQNKRILLENAAQLQPFSFAAVNTNREEEKKNSQTCARVHEIFLSFLIWCIVGFVFNRQ